MDELEQLLSDSATRLFKDHGEIALAKADIFDQSYWAKIKELGFPYVLLSEENGGVGGSWSYAKTILHPAGLYSTSLPISEAMLALHLLESAGLEATGELVLAGVSYSKLNCVDDGFKFTGLVKAVPWGRYANQIVTTAEFNQQAYVLLLDSKAASITQNSNLAGEPRDHLSFDNTTVQAAISTSAAAQNLQSYAALLRLAQVVGALENALQMSVDYANERKQFGRVIAKFQAVQQQLAIVSSEIAAVSCAIRAAFDAADAGHAEFQIAAAKLRANETIGKTTATAHQVFAAIGFTWEHTLRLSTQRLLSWRNEYGNDSYWSNRLGDMVASRGANNFWRDLTQRDDRVSNA